MPTPATREHLLDYFGRNTFNDAVMQERLPKDIYKRLQATIKKGARLEQDVANAVAHAMKEWAVSRGVTHFTHWFQPMTGLTAEKHDAFLDIDQNGRPMERFSGAMLIQGEPDASSFPSGGMRSTFEARGYTMWDPSSPAFIMENDKGGILCIPTVFISYNGEALDKKAPLLRSMKALEQAAARMLKLFGRGEQHVTTTLGPEQEYFLIDLDYYNKRPDLILAGRTLIGAEPPKGQQMEDHYFGSIKERVLNFMQDAEYELYKLGVPAKTRHNEVAPHQFEIAPIFSEANVAADRNQLVMEVLKRVAQRNGLALLLHEKPFAGINGSGKHLNWSIVDGEGHNLLDPGQTPSENVQFLMFLVAVLEGVYRYADLLRASIASAGNDHRLGANEAPPAIMSVFLGSTLSTILDSIESGNGGKVNEQKIIDLGIAKLPQILQDNTDRNRTSPFAFTGNKFEFRALGSASSISTPATMLNGAVAMALTHMADDLEKALAEGQDFNDACFTVLKKYIAHNKPVRFEGNGYSEEWLREAEKRGLPNLKDTPAALEVFTAPKNQTMLTQTGIFSKEEITSRYNTKLERYCNTLGIEYEMLLSMTRTYVAPAAIKYQNGLIKSIQGLKELGDAVSNAALAPQIGLLKQVSSEIGALLTANEDLAQLADKVKTLEDEQKKAEFIAARVIPVMNRVRQHCDSLEELLPDDLWPLPKYRELLFIM
ncbi:MAG: glutamine synthetase type III [Calditrichaeota bacterium]|nr:MAG: glutamine synthetase type III [Calditrichota bacterium]